MGFRNNVASILNAVKKHQGDLPMNKISKTLFGALLSLAFVLPAQAETLMMATTTSTDNSGLLDFLAPSFKAETGIDLKWVAVGTGKALEIAKNCDADVLLVHAPAVEKKFVADGFGVDRRQIMYNDFVILGPKADPAKVAGKTTAEALKAIYDAKAVFVSRGDKSGTHNAEKKLWKANNLTPDQEKFYISAGQGMMATIAMAAEKGGYTLTDRATWIKFAAKQGDANPLAIVVEGDKALFNQYSVMTTNPARCNNVKVELAKQFEDWWVDPKTQKRIGEYTLEGKQLFFPNAGK
jgi:tungstate transport system substrate-binding protein